MTSARTSQLDTLLIHGDHASRGDGYIMPPVQHASTILFSSTAELEARGRDKYNGPFYGRIGTSTTFAFEDAMARAEGGFRSVAVPSGTAAVAAAILGFARDGDHILMSDSAWGSARRMVTGFLATLGVQVSFYDPSIGSGIDALIEPNTKIIYLESPGSLTFDVQDVPAIVEVARHRGVTTLIDNTWASPVFFHPLKLGVDVSIVAATKYIVGHSDAMMGVAICNEASYQAVRDAASALGYHAAPDDCYLAYRGLTTAALRMHSHETQALALAKWFQQQPEVARVFHPALPEHPGHALWKRDFSGSSGLFSVEFHPIARASLLAWLDRLELFGKGASWGGLRSLIIPHDPAGSRTVHPWTGGQLIRVHAGLENIDDLIADVTVAFQHLRSVSTSASTV
jgi:cysteine-S-conjugate beta-lyase